MRVLIADKFEQSGRDGLDAAGCEFSYQPDVKDESLVEAVRSYQPDVLVVRGTKVSEGMLDAGALKLIVRAGAGFNTIDVAAASRRGVYVSNCPGKNSVAVAELAFALILALDRRIPDNVIQLRAGQWNKKEFSKARGLLGRTLGLIGTGQIGREMVARARGFGMPVIAWSRSLTEEGAAELGVERRESLRDVARDSDIVSVHVALKPETRGLIDRDFFDAMREGAYFINTSRGEVVDEEALRRAMRERSVRAGLDVFAAEPAGATGEFTDEIALEPNLYGTHHIGASTDQAQEAIAAETVRIIKTFKETGRVPNVVNLARRTPATHTLVVRHRDRPGVLASVLDSIRLASINVQEMENIIFEGSEAAVARINLESALPSDVLERLKTDNADIIELSLLEIRQP
ncbi:MAG: D-3-phosphoglycerate dehydrogenase / 2-oxoglutarate reductase [Acidobacteriota bacterium]|jgi:D-3-phosphoglycerate dehydrogenase|nr:D-3-phosphoglycerate dehydrogenase / 2-oxoglutarate reductase [Acidobacteriota bacterium]